MYNAFAKFFSQFDKTDVYIIVITCLITWLIVKIRNNNRGPVSWDHFWQNLDKFLVTFMFIFVFVVAVKSSQPWVQDLVKQLLPAVLALLGATRAFQSRSGQGSSTITTTPAAPAIVTVTTPGAVVTPTTNVTSAVIENTETPTV